MYGKFLWFIVSWMKYCIFVHVYSLYCMSWFFFNALNMIQTISCIFFLSQDFDRHSTRFLYSYTLQTEFLNIISFIKVRYKWHILWYDIQRETSSLPFFEWRKEKQHKKYSVSLWSFSGNQTSIKTPTFNTIIKGHRKMFIYYTL